VGEGSGCASGDEGYARGTRNDGSCELKENKTQRMAEGVGFEPRISTGTIAFTRLSCRQNAKNAWFVQTKEQNRNSFHLRSSFVASRGLYDDGRWNQAGDQMLHLFI